MYGRRRAKHAHSQDEPGLDIFLMEWPVGDADGNALHLRLSVNAGQFNCKSVLTRKVRFRAIDRYERGEIGRETLPQVSGAKRALLNRHFAMSGRVD